MLLHTKKNRKKQPSYKHARTILTTECKCETSQDYNNINLKQRACNVCTHNRICKLCTLIRMVKETTASTPKNMPTNIMMSPTAIFFPTMDKPKMIPLEKVCNVCLLHGGENNARLIITVKTTYSLR